MARNIYKKWEEDHKKFCHYYRNYLSKRFESVFRSPLNPSKRTLSTLCPSCEFWHASPSLIGMLNPHFGGIFYQKLIGSLPLCVHVRDPDPLQCTQSRAGRLSREPTPVTWQQGTQWPAPSSLLPACCFRLDSAEWWNRTIRARSVDGEGKVTPVQWFLISRATIFIKSSGLNRCDLEHITHDLPT